MKTFSKSFVVGLVALTLVFLPGLISLANAGGVNYEGFSGYRVDNSMGNDDNVRGLMFNFSFGGPKDYKENKTIQDIYKASLTSKEKGGIFLGVISIAALILYITDDDDGCSEVANGHLIDVTLAATSEIGPPRCGNIPN